jgi:hypothetical protein
MGSDLVIEEKCLLVKEKWAILVDTAGPALILSAFPVVGRVPTPFGFSRFSHCARLDAVCAAAWWRYWGAPEEAIALA